MGEETFNLVYYINWYTGQFQLIYALILPAYIEDRCETHRLFCKEVVAVIVELYYMMDILFIKTQDKLICP